MSPLIQTKHVARINLLMLSLYDIFLFINACGIWRALLIAAAIVVLLLLVISARRLGFNEMLTFSWLPFLSSFPSTYFLLEKACCRQSPW